jgi:vitamin B12 transporter
MHRITLPAAIGLLGFSALCAAQDTTLDTVIITATRTAETVGDTLASVTVIDRAAIEDSQASSVQELLRGQPGISIANNGGPGRATSLFMRGTESDHVLVLIDGIKVGSATSGAVAFQDIPLEQIERIEIVRGPRSSLYGSEAIGGVIQFFTRKSTATGVSHASIGAGSHHSYRASTGFAVSNTQGWLNLNLGAEDTEGFNACRGSSVAGCYTVEPDRDGYDKHSATLRGGYALGERTELEFTVAQTDAEVEYDGGYQNQTDSKQSVLAASLLTEVNADWQLSLRAGRSKDQSDNLKDGVFSSRFDTRRDTFALLNELTLGDRSSLTLGADYQQDHIDSTTAYAVTERENSGVFGQYQLFGAHQNLAISLRRDDNEQFGNHNTGNLSWGYTFADNLRFVASYGTAFKAPTFNELYYPFGYGNPDLKPERAKSSELSLRGHHWSASLFQTDVEELIAYNPATFSVDNISRARIHGLELGYSAELGAWLLDSQITLLTPRHRGGDANRNNLLPRRAQQTLRLDLTRDYGRFDTTLSLYASGKRFDDLGNKTRLGGYATLDLKGRYRLNPQWNLQGQISNLLDKQYETAAYYNQDGRALFLSLNYTP